MNQTPSKAMTQHLFAISVLVPDYDEAIAHYCGDLGFELTEDTDMGGGKRFVRVTPPGGQCHLLLAKAKPGAQTAAIGNQFGGRVGLFLHTDDFARDYAAYQAKGIEFCEPAPRHEVYGTVIVFQDKYGTKWDLVQPAA